MPIDNNLLDRPFLINFKTGEKPNNKYISHIDAINITLIDSPTPESLMKYIPNFASGTWRDHPKKDFTKEEKLQVIDDLFDGCILPTALETMKFTFLIEGLDLSDVAHLIRHRTLSFSASGTGDRDCRMDNILLKDSFVGSKYELRIKSATDMLMEVYSESLDDPEIPHLDPRTILPRNTTNYYYMSGDFKAIKAFVLQRKDTSIEPSSMNLIALKIWLEVCKIFPRLKDKISFTEPDRFAIETSKGNRSSNFYLPSDKNDIPDYKYKKSWFIKDKRENMRGEQNFLDKFNLILKEIDNL